LGKIIKLCFFISVFNEYFFFFLEINHHLFFNIKTVIRDFFTFFVSVESF
jgi:hypothetical protein